MVVLGATIASGMAVDADAGAHRYPEGGDAGGPPEAPPDSTEGSGEAAGTAGAADFPDDRSSDTDFGTTSVSDIVEWSLWRSSYSKVVPVK